MADHTWFVASTQRYCTTCGEVQTAAPGPPPHAWTPDVPECPGGTPSNAADLIEGGVDVVAKMAKLAPKES